MPRFQHLSTLPGSLCRSLRLARPAHCLGLLALLAALTACGAQQPAALPTAAATAAPEASLAQERSRSAPQLSAAMGGTIELDDSTWQGGIAGPDGRTYDGHSVIRIYGTATDNHVAHATFTIEGQPFGMSELLIAGLDAAGADKTPIRLTLNDHEIYKGPSPLPDDDGVPNSTAWDSYSWTVDAQLLRQGQNVLAIANLAAGAADTPPFLLLDYAELTYEEQ